MFGYHAGALTLSATTTAQRLRLQGQTYIYLSLPSVKDNIDTMRCVSDSACVRTSPLNRLLAIYPLEYLVAT